MNTLIDPLKRIARDLVDKKLWPVAVALLAALVAVPLLIGGSSAEEAPAPVAVAATAPDGPGSKSLITVVDQAVTGKDTRPGRVADPFYDPPEPPAQPTASGGAATDTGAASTGGGTPSGDSPSSTAPATPAAPAPTARPAEEPAYYRTVVRWYETEPGKPQPISRLEPFGGLADPAALYLGVTRSGGNYAVFLLGPDATSDGEAKCDDEPNCRVIGLKSGQSQIITVQPPDGGAARRYHLEVVSVKAVETDAAKARSMRAKVHADGRDVMRRMWQHRPTAEALQPIQYDRDSGLLVKSGGSNVDAAKAPE